MTKVFILLFLCFPVEASAQFNGGLNTARNLGFAGVGAVNAEATGLNLMLNPAALSLYADLKLGVGREDGESVEGVDQKAYYGWAKDSIASSFKTRRNYRVQQSHPEAGAFPISAAVAFSDHKTDLGNYKAYELALSRVVTKKISLGISTKYFDGRLSGSEIDKWVSGLGLVYKRSNKLVFGLSWLNMNSNDNLVERLRFGAGLYFSELARLFFDVDYSLEDVEDEWSVGGGFEASIREFFAFRAGYFAGGGEKDDSMGFGLSFQGPKLKLHYGVKIEVDSRAALHSVDLSLPL